MIRVALDYRPALYARGGIARCTRELARALAARSDIEVHLFGHGWRQPLEAEPAAGTLHRSRLPGRALGPLAAIGVDAPRLAGRAEVFHWTDYVYPPVRAGAARVVMTVHDLAFLHDDRFHGPRQSRVLARRFRRALRRADLVLCPSRATADALAREGGHPRVRVVPFGVDHVQRFACDAARGHRRAANRLGTEAPYLVTVGTLEPRKNHPTLLEALAALSRAGRSLPLLCVGSGGWLSEDVRTRLQSGELGFPCAWTGSLPDAELFDLVAGARGLVYPSSLEGFGFPPLEALALGVPVVAGDCAALREHVGDAALLADGTDRDALADAILTLWDDEAARARGLTAWRLRAHRYRWARCAEEHASAYGELAARGAVS